MIVALQISLDDVNRIMQEREGMGKTGETYLIGSDRLMRSDSHLDPTWHSVKASFANPEKGKVDTVAANEALAGREGARVIIDYNGNPVLSAYAPLTVWDNQWAIIAEIDEAEAFAAVTRIKWLNTIVALSGVIAIITVAWLIARSITRPVT